MFTDTLPYCVVEGRKGLKIYFNKTKPELYLQDKTLAGLEDEKLKAALKKPFIVIADIGILVEYKTALMILSFQKVMIGTVRMYRPLRGF